MFRRNSQSSCGTWWEGPVGGPWYCTFLFSCDVFYNIISNMHRLTTKLQHYKGMLGKKKQSPPHLGYFNLIFCFLGWPLLRIGSVGRLGNEIPYSRKYWRALNLAVEPKIAIARILADLNLAVRYGIAIRIYASRKFWRILIWRL